MKKLLCIILLFSLVGCSLNTSMNDIKSEEDETIQFESIVEVISKYDNGITSEDYVGKQGERCWHPRGVYELENYKVCIYSDPHVLFTYFVVVKDLENLKNEKIYVDLEVCESIKEELLNMGFVRTDY